MIADPRHPVLEPADIAVEESRIGGRLLTVQLVAIEERSGDDVVMGPPNAGHFEMIREDRGYAERRLKCRGARCG